MTGIIAALDKELRLILDKLTDVEQKKVGGINFYIGHYNSHDVVCAVCGVGKVFAAMCCQAMIISFSPSLIINTGVAGALSEQLKVLDCTVSEKFVQHDIDTTPLGDAPGLVSGINKVVFTADETASKRLCDCYGKLGKKAFKCIMASGDQFIADKKTKDRIINTFGAHVCEMESASMAQVCYVNDVPFVASRVMSDNADGTSAVSFQKVCETAAEISCQAVLLYIERFGE